VAQQAQPPFGRDSWPLTNSLPPSAAQSLIAASDPDSLHVPHACARAVRAEGAEAMDESQRREYWRTNLRLMATLLAVWFTVSYLCAILLVQPLNNIVINGFPLGFWFAQQGSIITFVVLIGIYVWRMDRLDDRYGISDRSGTPTEREEGR
jgi:putative solute:sodium symporter small subunit